MGYAMYWITTLVPFTSVQIYIYIYIISEYRPHRAQCVYCFCLEKMAVNTLFVDHIFTTYLWSKMSAVCTAAWTPDGYVCNKPTTYITVHVNNTHESPYYGEHDFVLKFVFIFELSIFSFDFNFIFELSILSFDVLWCHVLCLRFIRCDDVTYLCRQWGDSVQLLGRCIFYWISRPSDKISVGFDDWIAPEWRNELPNQMQPWKNQVFFLY